MDEAKVLESHTKYIRLLLLTTVACIGAALVMPGRLAADGGAEIPGMCIATFSTCCQCFSCENGTCIGRVPWGHNFCETVDDEVFCGASGATCYVPLGEV